MENAKGKKWNSTKKAKACKSQPVEADGKHQAAGKASTGKTSGKEIKRKRPMGDDKASSAQEETQDNKRVRIRKKITIPPLPSVLPPVNLLHRDIVRAWCQQLKLGSKGLKWEAYKRLCENAYPNQKAIPVTSKDARMLSEPRRKLELEKGNITLEGFDLPGVTASSEQGATALLEGMDSVVVTTSTPDAVFASWSRIASRSAQVETVKSPQEASGVNWCVVHGQSLPADTEGWARLQFYAGQAWVPDKPGRVCALFLLPACNFPPPHLEDNMLCPKCIHRNKVLMKSLQ
ncbi:developmental pluripotency-associated protein 4 [Saccopteryx bilineata]|uniref:developmental pluripotency-associated protein 4 n=1 Tax=Saccopteryx bilineata TaxID=59482 RepID=UPI00338F663B